MIGGTTAHVRRRNLVGGSLGGRLSVRIWPTLLRDEDSHVRSRLGQKTTSQGPQKSRQGREVAKSAVDDWMNLSRWLLAGRRERDS